MQGKEKTNSDIIEETSQTASTSSMESLTIEVSEQFGLQRELGFISSVSIIVGTIVGSGIFVSPKGVLEGTGSVALSLIVWIGGGGIALLGGLCYAELGTLVPKSGGEYAYLRVSMGNVMAFLYTWVSILINRTASVAIMALTMAEYVATWFEACGQPEIPKKLTAAAAIVAVGILNSYSTRLAARVQVFTTAFKVCALVIILGGGIIMLCQGKTENLNNGFEGSTHSPSTIALAFYDVLWAYDGWQNLNYVTEEVKDPARTLPRANIVAVLLVTVLYAMTNVSYLTLMTSQELLEAPAVAVLWGNRILKGAAVLIPISVVVSTFGSANGSAFTAARTVFAAARDHNLPDVLAYIHVKQRTPLASIVFSIAVTLVMIGISDISGLIDLFSFLSWFFYGLTFAAVLILRFKMKDAPRPYRVPLVIPIIMLLISVYLVVAPIIESPKMEFLYASLLVLAGLVFYFPFVIFKLKVPGFDQFTVATQLLMEVSPTDYHED